MHFDVRELALLLHDDAVSVPISLGTLEEELDLGGRGEIAAGREPRNRKDLWAHLVVCPRCRRRFANVLLTSTDDDEMASVLYDRFLADDSPEHSLEIRLFVRATELEEDMAHQLALEASAAQGTLEELLWLPQRYREEAIAEGGDRFRSLGLADQLLAAAAQADDDDLVVDARRLAFLATRILEALPDGTRQRRLRATAYCTIADMERRRGLLEAAEEFLVDAVDLLADDQLQDRSRVNFCLALGRLRREQNRVDEALALFERARLVAEELADDEGHAKAALSLGWLLLAEYEPEASLEPLWEAYNLLRDDQSHRFLSVLHGLALAYADTRRVKSLEEVLLALEALKEHLPAPLAEVHIPRIQAQADWLRGERARAILGFEACFRHHASEGHGIETALAALELARHLLDKDPIPSRESFAEILETLGRLSPQQLPPHVAEVVTFALLFPLKFPTGHVLETLLSAERWTERARFNPALQFFPLDTPDLVLPWQKLSNARRQQAADSAGVELVRIRTGRTERLEPQSVRDGRLITWTHAARTGTQIVSLNEPTPDDETEAD